MRSSSRSDPPLLFLGPSSPGCPQAARAENVFSRKAVLLLPVLTNVFVLTLVAKRIVFGFRYWKNP